MYACVRAYARIVYAHPYSNQTISHRRRRTPVFPSPAPAGQRHHHHHRNHTGWPCSARTAFNPCERLAAAATPHNRTHTHEISATTTATEESKQSRFDGRVFACECVCVCMRTVSEPNVVVVAGGGVHTDDSFICISTGVIGPVGTAGQCGGHLIAHICHTHTSVGSHCARTAGTNKKHTPNIHTHIHCARCVYTEVFDDDGPHTESRGEETTIATRLACTTASGAGTAAEAHSGTHDTRTGAGRSRGRSTGVPTVSSDAFCWILSGKFTRTYFCMARHGRHHYSTPFLLDFVVVVL